MSTLVSRSTLPVVARRFGAATQPPGAGYDLTRPRVKWLHDLSWALVLGGLVMYLGLSASALRELGIPYATPYGNPVFKIHPGTYSIMLGYALGLTSFGNPLRIAAIQWGRQPLLLFVLACNVFLFVWGVWRHGISGAAFVIETLWMPPICLAAMMLQPVSRQRAVLYAMSIMLVTNALMALAEFALKRSFIPTHDASEDYVGEVYFRASALMGHHLNNALLTMTLLPIITQLLPIPIALRGALFLLLHLALLSFGGRAAFMMSCVSNVLFAAYVGLRGFVQSKYTYVQVLATLVSVMLVSAAVVGTILSTGLGDRIFKTELKNDNSAQVRLQIWNVFDHMTREDMAFGISPARIEEVSRQIGLDTKYEAIENYWIGIQMQMGFVGFVPFVLGQLALVIYMWRRATGWQRLSIIAFVVVGSGGNTLATKTPALTLLACSIQAGLAMRAWWLGPGNLDDVMRGTPKALPRRRSTASIARMPGLSGSAAR